MTLASARLAPRLRGVIAALVTPFHSDGTLDLASFDAQVAHVLAGGVHAVVLNGTTGESPTVRWQEVETLLPRLRGAVAESGREVPIIVGTGTADTAESCDRTARARLGGADAALAVTPYYSRPSAAGVLAHYEALAAVGLPLVAYHIPSRTGLALTAGELLAVLRVPGVVALKESSGNVSMTLALTSGMKELAPALRPSLLCGDDALFLPALAAGASGGLLASASLVPRELVRLFEAHVAGKNELALARAARLAPLLAGLYREPNPAPLKAALAARGVIATSHLRLPLVTASAGLTADLVSALDALDAEVRPR